MKRYREVIESARKAVAAWPEWMRREMRAESRALCQHENGWRSIEDGRHDVLVRECADGCGETQTIGQANRQRWNHDV